MVQLGEGHVVQQISPQVLNPPLLQLGACLLQILEGLLPVLLDADVLSAMVVEVEQAHLGVEVAHLGVVFHHLHHFHVALSFDLEALILLHAFKVVGIREQVVLVFLRHQRMQGYIVGHLRQVLRASQTALCRKVSFLPSVPFIRLKDVNPVRLVEPVPVFAPLVALNQHRLAVDVDELVLQLLEQLPHSCLVGLLFLQEIAADLFEDAQEHFHYRVFLDVCEPHWVGLHFVLDSLHFVPPVSGSRVSIVADEVEKGEQGS